jgi:hypothetical protein
MMAMMTAPPPPAQASLMEKEPGFENACAVGTIRLINKVYGFSYQAMYLFLLLLLVVVVPFVGLGVGAVDVLLAILVRPFARVVGRIFKDLFWSSHAIAGSLIVTNHQAPSHTAVPPV